MRVAIDSEGRFTVDTLLKFDRKTGLELAAADSGRTWILAYKDIRTMEPGAFEHGDVLVLRDRISDADGVSFMQAIPHLGPEGTKLVPIKVKGSV